MLVTIVEAKDMSGCKVCPRVRGESRCRVCGKKFWIRSEEE